MGDETKPNPGKEQKSGLPQIQVMHVIIAVAFIVLAVIYIAKFGFGMDLISPSSGEMAIVKRPVTPVQTIVQNPVVKPTVSFRPETLCPANQTLCGNSCTNRMTDTENCGACGNVCFNTSQSSRSCTEGKCVYRCSYGYQDCNQNIADGCEVSLSIDANNCGRCGTVCSSGQVCSLFQCMEPGGGPERVPPPQQW